MDRRLFITVLAALLTAVLVVPSIADDRPASTSSSPLWGSEDAIAEDSITIAVDPEDPTTIDECKDGGWEDFGFDNQGRCMQFVLTGRDSRQP